MPSMTMRKRFQVGDCAFELIEYAFRLLLESRRDRRERNASCATVEKLESNGIFELLDRGRKGRLGQEQFSRREGERAGVGNSDNSAKVAQRQEERRGGKECVGA